jgi:hypothetical protein
MAASRFISPRLVIGGSVTTDTSGPSGIGKQMARAVVRGLKR